ncbi:MAG: YecA family protein [Sedimentibacter sp.]
MNNNNFIINKEKKSKIVNLAPKLGRNDPCYCGSGKKYKNCCMKKDEEKKHIKYLLEQPMLISDEYFSVNEYIEISGYPLINFDMLLLEILNMTGSILHIFNSTNDIVYKDLLKKLYHYAKEFYNGCLNCEYGCIQIPQKSASFKSLRDKGFNVEELPVAL